jgi:hypothetical protein
MFLIIALNIISAVIVVASIVGLQAHAILASRVETSPEPRRRRARTQVARRRLATVNG